MTIFLWFVSGIALGLAAGHMLKRMYQELLTMKAEDGTAEFIQGEPYYIVSRKDWTLLEGWRLPVLRHADMLKRGTVSESETHT